MQIYAATNGFLDRLNVERVTEFLLELTERMHSQHGDVREKIAGGDWSDETQKAVHDAVESFAADFGYDLDEEGQPLDDETPQLAPRAAGADQPGRRAREPDGRGARGGLGPARRHGHGLSARRQEQDRLGEEHPEDHPCDGDGRRRAPAPRRAADRRAAPVCGRDRAHDAPGGAGGRRGGGARAAAARARLPDERRPAAGHRRPRPGGRLQLADHPRRRAPLRRARPRRGCAAAGMRPGAAASPRWPSAGTSSAAATRASPIDPPTPTRARSPTT